MDRLAAIQNIRQILRSGGHSIGSWMQIPHPSVAEIMGQAGYDWVAVDLEHGSISVHQLPDLFRALELGATLPLVRLMQGQAKDCKQALDAGAGGVIVPMVASAEYLKQVKEVCCWPPAGSRGVGFSRANLFGKHFTAYAEEAQAPLLIAQIEHIRAVENLASILKVEGLDAILVGPYDLSASMGITAQFEHPSFKEAINHVRQVCQQQAFPLGIHIVQPDPSETHQRIVEGYQFIAYSIDAVILNLYSQRPEP
ncbi:MAG: aldolase/citrate lyase family protein [Cyanobacteria bacterium J06635_15]